MAYDVGGMSFGHSMEKGSLFSFTGRLLYTPFIVQFLFFLLTPLVSS